MKYFICLLLIMGCATAPDYVKKEIQVTGLAGYWVSYKYSFDGKNKGTIDRYVNIDCDGGIKYSILHPEALLFKEDTDDGKILELSDNKVKLKSWIGLEYQYDLSKPERQTNGCMKIYFKGESFQTFYPVDCKQPRKTFYEIMDEAFEHMKKNDYVYCD